MKRLNYPIDMEGFSETEKREIDYEEFSELVYRVKMPVSLKVNVFMIPHYNGVYEIEEPLNFKPVKGFIKTEFKPNEYRDFVAEVREYEHKNTGEKYLQIHIERKYKPEKFDKKVCENLYGEMIWIFPKSVKDNGQ